MKKSYSVLPKKTFLSVLVGSILFSATIILQNFGLLKGFDKLQLAGASQIPQESKQEARTIDPDQVLRVPILLYHYVEYIKDEKDTIRKSLNINPNIFERQVQTLLSGGFTFMRASDLGDVLDGKFVVPKKPVLLTFDDGYRDFYTDVFPILKKYRIKATVYIVPGFIDGPNSMYFWQLKEISESGLVDIGAHTMNHVHLEGLPLGRVQDEVLESKKVLEKNLGISVVSFAYPNGAFDKQSIEVIKNAGFTTAVTTTPGIEVNLQNRYFIYRIRPGARTGEDLLKYLEQNSFKAW